MKIFPTLTLALGLTAGVYAAGGVGDKTASRFKTEAVRRGSITLTVSTTGTVTPEEVVDIGAQVNGRIVKFGLDVHSKPIDYNSPVKAGTVLAQLDSAPYKAAVDKARASLQRAEAELQLAKAKVAVAEDKHQRLKARLDNARVIDPAQVDETRLALNVARAAVPIEEAAVAEKKAALRETEVNLDYTIIRSPVDGIIIDRRVNIGQNVSASLTAPSLFLVAKDLKRMDVWATINEADIALIKPGQSVIFTVDAYPGKTFKGTVAANQPRLNASMTNNVVTYTAVVNTDNSSGQLLPYLTANLQFVVGELKNALLVPTAALRWRPRVEEVAEADQEAYHEWLLKGGPVVWYEDKGFARILRLKIGVSGGTQTEVLGVVGDNLPVGARVITGLRNDPRRPPSR
jgi:HlyD family secretion protein